MLGEIHLNQKKSVCLNLVSFGVLSPGAIHEAHADRQFKVSDRLLRLQTGPR